MLVMLSMRGQFFAGIAVAVLALVGLWAYAGWGGSTSQEGVSATVVEEFTAVMRAKVVAEVGQPIEGFEPSMFMQAYPSLKAQDFHTVDALIGLYRYQGGELVYDLNGEQELHSAARAISDAGMQQLLLNVATRLEVDLEEAGALAVIFEALAQPAVALPPTHDSPPGEPQGGGNGEVGITTTLTGTIACLPHKGDGPHTMECAFGLKADNGNYYALKNLWEVAPEITDTNVRVRVVGSLMEVDVNETYDIEGVIGVISAVKI